MILRSLKKYVPFVKASWLTTLAYRYHVYLWVLSDVLSTGLMCLLWVAIYSVQSGGTASGIINGFTLMEMIQYVLYVRIAASFVGYTETFWSISEDIRTGSIAMTLLKPISYRIKNMASSIGVFSASFVMLSLPLLLLFTFVFWQLGVPTASVMQFFMFVLTSFFGLLIVDSIDFLFGLVSIFTGALFGLGQIKSIIFEFLSGAILPIAFFPQSVQAVVQFLPYHSMISSPVNILLGKITMDQYGNIVITQLVWVVVLNLACKLVFDRFVKHVVAVGG